MSNENKANPGVALQLGGKERRLRLPLRAILDIKNELGVDLLKGVDGLSFGAEELPKLIHILCRQDDPDLTIDEILDDVDFSEITAFSDGFIKAMENALPSAAKEGAKKKVR